MRSTLLVQLVRINIEALVDTGVKRHRHQREAFTQVAEKDKVRLDIHGDQLGLTGVMKTPLDIVGLFKI